MHYAIPVRIFDDPLGASNAIEPAVIILRLPNVYDKYVIDISEENYVQTGNAVR